MSKQIKPTEGELEILGILWEKGSATVREVFDVLTQSKESGYTTTLKLMQIMHEKGLLERDDTNRSHVYKAAVNREQTQGQIVKRMIDTVFNGSPMNLVMQALGNHKASADELEQIKSYLAAMEKKNKK